MLTSGLTALFAVLSRLGNLAILLAGTAALPHTDYAWLAVAMGLSAATQVLLDPGAVAYLSVIPSEDEYETSVRRMYGLQAVAGMISITVFIIVGAVALRGDLTSSSWAIGAVGLLPVAENFARVTRVRWLRHHQLSKYRAVDLGLAVIKGGIALALIARVGVGSIVAGTAIAVIAATGIVVVSLRGDYQRNPRLPTVGREWMSAVQFGLPTMAAGAYSQIPVVLMAAFAPISDAAVLATATRLVQPVEIVPGSISQMYLPQIARRRSGGKLVWGLAALGVPAAIATGTLGAVLLSHAEQHAATVTALVILSCALPLKFANYGQAAVLTGLGKPLVRLIVSLSTGAIALVAVAIALPHGPDFVALSMACSESVLFVLLFIARKAVK
ncbi:hypothetical protein [uncultured Microbacterium sp.]|jgi:O-antigen/teichoic acid export membrane protein|nr:hypothetical protein [uncultured Microbacterium sp.]